MAAPTVLGVIDTYGIELIHPMRDGRSPRQIGRKGLSHHRWIVGSKLCLLLNQSELVVAWACDTANVADNTLQWLIRQFEERVIVLSLTVVCHLKRIMHRVWEYFQARLAFTIAAFYVLVQWHGFQPHAAGFVPLSIAEFSLQKTTAIDYKSTEPPILSTLYELLFKQLISVLGDCGRSTLARGVRKVL